MYVFSRGNLGEQGKSTMTIRARGWMLANKEPARGETRGVDGGRGGGAAARGGGNRDSII